MEYTCTNIRLALIAGLLDLADEHMLIRENLHHGARKCKIDYIKWFEVTFSYSYLRSKFLYI